MKISEFCIKRPVFATVINLIIILVGLVSFKSLTIREYPNISVPVVNVETHYPGASAEIVESRITRPIEDALSGVEGIDFMKSTSKDQTSQVTLRFNIDRNLEEATNDIRDRVGRARGLLPEEAKEPIITKVDANADPIIWLAVTSDRHPLMEISDYVDRVIKDRFEVIPGVASLMVVGDRKRSMRIWLDPDRLAAYQLTVPTVVRALQEQNIELPSGKIESQKVEFTVYAQTDLKKVDEFENIILNEVNGYLVRLKDVATIEVGPRDENYITRYNGAPCVALGIIKQSTANPLDIATALKKELPIVEDILPEGIGVHIGYDKTIVIDRSIRSVFKTIIEALILVVIVIFLFLRNVKATLIPIVTIPVSLIGAFALMYAFNFSINTLTLLAMVLAIGLVVDDAIVVLENIYRHIEEGIPPFKAAIQGSQEIGSAVVAMTLTLMAVFAPVAFSEGRIGKLFTEFAIVLAGTVLISGFTALTLSPMMSSKLLKRQHHHGRFFKASERFLNQISELYGKSLGFFLKKRFWVLGGLIVAVGLNGLLFKVLPSELTPQEDRGFVIGMGLGPQGATLEYADPYAKQMELLYNDIPEVNRFFMVVGYPSKTGAISFLGLKPWKERTLSQQDVVQNLAPNLFGITGLMAFPISPPSSISEGSFKGPVEFVIQVPGDYKQLSEVVTQVMEKAKGFPGLSNLDSDLKLDKPQINLSVNREKAKAAGLNIDSIGISLQTLFAGDQITYFKHKGKQYDVVLQADKETRQSPRDLSAVLLKAKDGSMVQLSNFIETTQTIAPTSLNHFNKLPSAILTATLNPGTSLEDALNFLNQTAHEVSLEVMTDYAGTSRAFKRASSTLFFTFALALCVIFLVLAAQFESFIDPFIIMLSVPLAILGALFTMYATGGTLNIYSQIGLITLIGLITKHGILIVEFAKEKIAQGVNPILAVKESAILRLRPILMTTGATVLGATPLALATGAGAESRQEIGWVIVGGMLIGTLFTLYVVPIMFSFLARANKRISKTGELGEITS